MRLLEEWFPEFVKELGIHKESRFIMDIEDNDKIINKIKGRL